MHSVVELKEVFLTPRHLGIVMEYLAGGNMHEYVMRKGRLKESEARWYFQQLIVGVDYLHRMVRCRSMLQLSAAALCNGRPSAVLYMCGTRAMQV